MKPERVSVTRIGNDGGVRIEFSQRRVNDAGIRTVTHVIDLPTQDDVDALIRAVEIAR